MTKRGRPKLPPSRVRAQHQLRLSPDEYDAQAQAAAVQGVSWSVWARRILDAAAGFRERVDAADLHQAEAVVATIEQLSAQLDDVRTKFGL